MNSNEPALARFARQTRPVWLCLACGVLLYGWMFSCLGLLSILVHDALPKWRGTLPQILRSLDVGDAPIFWLTHHLAILGALGLLLGWLRLRAPARALAIITAVWSAVAIAAFLGMWAAFFLPSGVMRYPLNVIFAFASCAMLLSLIFSTWYAATGSKTALVVFVCLPIVQLAAFLFAAPPGRVTRHTGEMLPWFYPSIGSFLGIVAATGFCFWLIRASARRYGLTASAAPAYWALGILTNWALQLQLCAAAMSLMPLIMMLFSETSDTRWQTMAVRLLIALEAALALAVVWAWPRSAEKVD